MTALSRFGVLSVLIVFSLSTSPLQAQYRFTPQQAIYLQQQANLRNQMLYQQLLLQQQLAFQRQIAAQQMLDMQSVMSQQQNLYVKSPSQAPTVSQPQQASVWVGDEDLAGFGRLEFQFRGSEVTMIDAAGTHLGTLVRNGDTFTMRFPGIANYVGRLRGNELVGTGRDDRNGVWNFSVRRQ